MNDYSYIKPVVDLTCWAEDETKDVINEFDHIIKNHSIHADGTLILRSFIVRLMEHEKEINPLHTKSDAIFNKLCLSTKEDLIYLLGAQAGTVVYLYCMEREAQNDNTYRQGLE